MTSVGGAKWCKDGQNTISEGKFLLALIGKFFLKPQAVLAASIKAYTLKKGSLDFLFLELMNWKIRKQMALKWFQSVLLAVC